MAQPADDTDPAFHNPGFNMFKSAIYLILLPLLALPTLSMASDTDPFAPFMDRAKIVEKLQGSWTVAYNDVWQVKGDQLTIFDGTQEATYKLEVLAPCLLEATGNGQTKQFQFAMDGDALFQGNGVAGVLKGDQYAVCADKHLFTFDGGDCTEWVHREGQWRGLLGARCSQERKGEHEVLKVEMWELPLDGTLRDANVEDRPAKRFPDFSAAKKAVQQN